MTKQFEHLARRGRAASTARECPECERPMRLERQEGKSRWFCCLGCEWLWELIEETDKVRSWVKKPLPFFSRKVQ